MKAVIAESLNTLKVGDVELDPPRAREVQVRMVAAGVCHSDLSALNGTIPIVFPTVLGHEGAGVVEAVGEGVTQCKVGDLVVMSFVPNCGTCFHCVRGEAYLCQAVPPSGKQVDGTTRLHRDGQDLNAFLALGNMAERVVVPSINVVPIDKSIPLSAAALIGCGVTTGVGAALNTARVEAGSTVAVFGCGGVGLSVIQGARIAGAARIFAVDLSAEKLEMAKRFGATDVVPPGEDAAKWLTKQTGQGVDYAFEVVGNPAVADVAMRATRRGGKTVLVGVGKLTENVSVNALIFPLSGKTLCGCMFGNANPRVDFPRLLGLYRAGKLDLEGMVTRTYRVDQAVEAFEDLKKGSNARGVILFDDP